MEPIKIHIINPEYGVKHAVGKYKIGQRLFPGIYEVVIDSLWVSKHGEMQLNLTVVGEK